MEKKYIIFLGVCIAISGIFIGLGMIYEPRTVTEYVTVEKPCLENGIILEEKPLPIHTINAPSPTPLPTPTPKKFGRWGGISGSIDHPPAGTSINAVESGKIDETVATGNGQWYVYHVGYWFDKKEWEAIPDYNKQAGVSVYDEYSN